MIRFYSGPQCQITVDSGHYWDINDDRGLEMWFWLFHQYLGNRYFGAPTSVEYRYKWKDLAQVSQDSRSEIDFFPPDFHIAFHKPIFISSFISSKFGLFFHWQTNRFFPFFRVHWDCLNRFGTCGWRTGIDLAIAWTSLHDHCFCHQTGKDHVCDDWIRWLNQMTVSEHDPFKNNSIKWLYQMTVSEHDPFKDDLIRWLYQITVSGDSIFKTTVPDDCIREGWLMNTFDF